MAKSLHPKPIVERADQCLTNPTLRLGKHGPQGWQVDFTSCDSSILQSVPVGMTVQSMRTGHVDLWQDIRTYPNKRYRLDVYAEPTGRTGRGPSAEIEACFTALKADQQIRSYVPPIMHVGGDAPAIHRAYFQCPESTGRLQVRLRICTRRPILIRHIRLIDCGDYLPQGHPLAIPPEPWRKAPPYLSDRILLCDGRKDARPLLTWLQSVFGKRNVHRIAPSAPLGATVRGVPAIAGLGPCWTPGATPESFAGVQHGSVRNSGATPKHTLGGDSTGALILDLPPAHAPSLHDLVAFSDHTIVIASLQTFAAAAQKSNLRGLRLQDRICGTDMPGATVTFADYHTRGFALADVVPYCWNDGQDRFAHRYLTASKAASNRLADMGIHASLATETGEAGTRKHPVAFFRRGRHGALIVMDPDGLEAPSAGEDVPCVFDLLWRSALGQDTVTLGQFVAPAPHYQGVMTDLTEAVKYFDTLEDQSTAVRLSASGNPPPMWLWPGSCTVHSPARRTLLVRTGFGEADWPAIYGLILWLKQIARKSRDHDPLVDLMRQHMRVLAWPITQPQNWRGCPQNVTDPSTGLQPTDLTGLIDLAVGDERHTVVLVPDKPRADLIQHALQPSWPWPTELVIAPQAFADEPLLGCHARVVSGRALSTGNDIQPRMIGCHGRAVCDHGIAHRGETHATGHGANMLICKILLPGLPQPHHAISTALTDLAACLLERLAFAPLGWIMPNRAWRQMSVNHVDTRSARQVFLADQAGKMVAVGRRRGILTVPPGSTLLGLR